MSSTHIPTTSPCSRCLPSLPGVRAGDGSPASTVLWRHYDFRPPVSPHFVSFAWRYHSKRSHFARTRPSAAVGGSPGVGHPVPPPGSSSAETAGSPTFLGNPDCALALLSDPDRTDTPGHNGAPARPPICPPRRLPHSYFRGSITRLRHWLSTLRQGGTVHVCHRLCQCLLWVFSDHGSFRQSVNHRQFGVLRSRWHIEVIGGRRDGFGREQVAVEARAFSPTPKTLLPRPFPHRQLVQMTDLVKVPHRLPMGHCPLLPPTQGNVNPAPALAKPVAHNFSLLRQCHPAAIDLPHVTSVHIITPSTWRQRASKRE